MDGQTKISKADTAEVITPKGTDVTVWRNKAADGSGVYYGKLPSGYNEPIGGPGVSTNKGIAAKITEIAPLNGKTRLKVAAADISHGVAPYTFLWEIASSLNGVLSFTIAVPPSNLIIEAPTIDGANNTDTVVLNYPSVDHFCIGDIRCKITDAQGEVCYANWHHFGAPALV